MVGCELPYDPVSLICQLDLNPSVTGLDRELLEWNNLFFFFLFFLSSAIPKYWGVQIDRLENLLTYIYESLVRLTVNVEPLE